MQISVIVPTLNINKYIPKLLKSIKIQDSKDFEIIFIDGNSTDGTLQTINDFKKEVAERFQVKVIAQTSKGISKAFNVGILESEGDYLIFMGGDDYFTDRSSLRKASDILSIISPDLLIGEAVKVYGGVLTRPEYTRASKYGFFYRLTYMMPVSHQNTFFKRSVFEKIGMYDEKLKAGMDMEILHKALKFGCKLIITNANFSTFVHRKSAASKRNIWGHFFLDIPRFFFRYGVFPILSSPILQYKYHRNVEIYWYDESKYKDSEQEPLDIFNLPF